MAVDPYTGSGEVGRKEKAAHSIVVEDSQIKTSHVQFFHEVATDAARTKNIIRTIALTKERKNADSVVGRNLFTGVVLYAKHSYRL